MCTVQSIKDAIRESCQSQYDMESTDIDQVLQSLPFSGMSRCSVIRRSPSVLTGPGRKSEQKQLKATVFFTKDCGFFHALRNLKGVKSMAVFRIERTRDYTVMSNHHLRNGELSLKSKGLLSMMLSLAGGLELHHQRTRQNLQGGRGCHRRCVAGIGGCRVYCPA